jgi:ParB family transcriptional regulator, chromosome partitioning protein
LVQIETAWRPAKEQRAGVLHKNTYRVLDITENPDADPPCVNTKTALIVFGRGAGTTVSVCVEGQCPVHNPVIAARIAREEAEHPAPGLESSPEDQTEEEAQPRETEDEQEQAEDQAEQDRRAAERKAAREREEEEYEDEVKLREEQHQARLACLEKIIEHAPASFTNSQLRLFVQLLLTLSPYGLFEDVAEHFSGQDENHDKTEDELLNDALASCEDDKLMGFVLRLLLTEHVAMPRGEQTDWLTTAERIFAPVEEKQEKLPKKRPSGKAKTPAESRPTKKKAA